ncbi:MAG: hypothetical protein NZT61_00060 [Deltaproteobacteria bacterium]|nr:hypothetical protein [Deltaproteobacteria bacterium]
MQNQSEAIVRIDGHEYSMNVSGIERFEDFLEILKGFIDPDNMIVEILYNGNQISDVEWNGPFAKFHGGSFDVKTDTPENFARSRLKESPYIVSAILKIIRESRLLFAEGKVMEANQLMITGVNALKEFFCWFGTVTQLAGSDLNNKYQINDIVEKLVKECEKVAQAQLYQSWWGISETLKLNVEPLLDELETRLRLGQQK